MLRSLTVDTRDAATKVSALLSVSRDVQAVADVVEIARRAARAVTHALAADTAIYFALDEETRDIVAVAGYRVPPAVRHATLRQPVADALLTDDSRFVLSLGLPPRSVLCALATRSGMVRGALVVCWWDAAHEPTGGDREFAAAVASHVAAALDAGRADAAVAANKTLFIVARHNEHLYQSLLRTFAGDHTVEIILDRRGTGRRRAPEAADAEQRALERRRLAEVESQLKRRGWAVVVTHAQ